MNLYRVNKLLSESIKVMEEDDCSDKGGRWVTINGAPVCVVGKKGKSGKIVFGPGSLKKPEAPDPQKKREQSEKERLDKAKKNVDGILGDDHPFGVEKGKDGEPEFGHPDVKEKVNLGKEIIDAFSGMLSYVDVIAAAAVKATGSLASRLEQATSDLVDALESWQHGH